MSGSVNGKDPFAFAMPLEELEQTGLASVSVGRSTLALVLHEDQVYAIDNRCPHMGFPMDRGSVRNGILTCHWHHARFDLNTGGAFDLWADDAPTFPVEIREGEIWVDVESHGDIVTQNRERLWLGLERGLSLVIGKACIQLEERKMTRDVIEAGLKFGCLYRQAGWGQGLTILGCMVNLLPDLKREDRARALFHGLAAVAAETSGSPYRHRVQPLPGNVEDRAQLKSWFREFMEVRDFEGAERCLITAIRGGGEPAYLMDMMASAVLDHRYIDVGHPMDFTNKAFQILDKTDWSEPETVLTSLVRGIAGAQRMEESHAWRHPVDLVELLHATFEKLEDALAEGAAQNGAWQGDPDCVDMILTGEPDEVVEYLLRALARGMPAQALTVHVCHAAAMRIAQFHTSNEISDWDTALHTFTFSNAIMQAFRRAPTASVLRGAFDAAMSIHLDRFLNIPAARIPQKRASDRAPEEMRSELGHLLNRQYQVNQAGALVMEHLTHDTETGRLRAALAGCLLREDRDFHTIQCIEASFALQDELKAAYGDQPWLDPDVPLVAAARYLAAHAPTMRSQGQTYSIALRLHRGEKIFEG